MKPISEMTSEELQEFASLATKTFFENRKMEPPIYIIPDELIKEE